jgi:hypothetical protein
MSSPDDIENAIRRANCEASEGMRRQLWEGIGGVLRPSTLLEQSHDRHAPWLVRTWRIAAVAALALFAVILWQTFDATNKVYALSDALDLLGQAKTIHTQTLHYGKMRWESWYDIENAREHTSYEGMIQKAYYSPEEERWAGKTVWDGQYVMKVDHVERSVRFERILSWEQEIQRRQLADLARNTILPEVLDHLDQYARIGKDKIDGQSYDIYRREWREIDRGIRYDIWISPRTGEIGRTRQWIEFPTSKKGWMLRDETEKIEIDQEPPADTFATNPPDGYTLENSKATADILRTDFLLTSTLEAYRLHVLPGFRLEDGSIVACWTVSGGPGWPEPNAAYHGLTWGGALPQTPGTVPGLLISPAVKQYGAISYRDENTPFTRVCAVGRHLVCTQKAGRVYEWAIYVPQEEIPNATTAKQTMAVVKRNIPDPNRLPDVSIGRPLKSLAVTPESLARYLSEAWRELSEDAAVPPHMNYASLLSLATQIRQERSLYEDFARELEKRGILGGVSEPVKVKPANETQ